MSFLTKLRAFVVRGRGCHSATVSEALLPESARTGLWGEGIAADFLERKGMKILGRRVKCFRDEIDIVGAVRVRDTEMLVFVEVKTRASERFGGGRAAMDTRKRHALCRAAAHYLRRVSKTPFRFNLVEVIGSMEAAMPPVVRHFENAFPMELRYVHTAMGRRRR